MRPFIVGQAC